MEYLAASINVQYKTRGFFLLLGVCAFLVWHGDVRSYLPREAENRKEEERTTVEWPVVAAALDTYDYTGNYPYIDYEFIEQYHQVLWHNIYTASTNDYAGTPLEEYLRPIAENDREMLALYGREHWTSLAVDYIVFDFNDDGLEDYMVCLHGSGWNHYWKGEYKGNVVGIYIRKDDNSLECVLTEDRVHLHDTALPDEHAPVAVLREKTEGYYSLVFPGRDCIWRYESGKYRACEISEVYVPSGEESDVVRQGIIWEEAKYIGIKLAEMPAGIDYEYIETNHRILRHNICLTPRDDYRDTILWEYLKDDIEEDEEQCRKLGVSDSLALTIDYFPFDFNDDGLEDYLVCYHGIRWSGSGGNSVVIYVQTSRGFMMNIC